MNERIHGGVDSRELWQHYGIVADVIVSSNHLPLRVLTLLKPYTNDFERADIHELLSGDILHQVIKPFKDHLVDWTLEFFRITYGEALGKVLIDELDRR